MRQVNYIIDEFKPVFILAYLAILGFLCVTSVQMYTGIGFEPSIGIVFTSLVFGIYTLNRFTDMKEDFISNSGRAVFFKEKKIFYKLSILALFGSLLWLIAAQKLNWFHVLLITMGFCYSYKLIPFYRRDQGIVFYRIKEMTFVKNLTVSFLWASAVFTIPILFGSSATAINIFLVAMLGVGLFVSTLNSTILDDIFDEAGDRLAKVKTLPTLWGGRNTYLFLTSVNGVWLCCIGTLFLMGRVDGSHTAFLTILALYAPGYMLLHRLSVISRGSLDFLAESDLLIFAIGLAVLSI